jgi:hypothetical protein
VGAFPGAAEPTKRFADTDQRVRNGIYNIGVYRHWSLRHWLRSDGGASQRAGEQDKQTSEHVAGAMCQLITYHVTVANQRTAVLAVLLEHTWITNTTATEAESSTSLKPKRAAGHDSESVPTAIFTNSYSNNSLKDLRFAQPGLWR